VLLPLFAWFSRFAWRRVIPQYPGHLYLALHLHAAWFAAGALFTLLTAFVLSSNALFALGFVPLAYVAWYTTVTLKHVFEESWTRTLVKGVLVGTAYAGALLLTSLGMLAYALARM